MAILDRLRTRLHARRLDRELAAGRELASDPLLRVRAEALTSPEVRDRLATRLEQIIGYAELAPRDAAVPVHVGAVKDSQSALASLAGALRERVPVSAQGVARAMILLTDGAGPLYWRASNLDLGVAARSALTALYMGAYLEVGPPV